MDARGLRDPHRRPARPRRGARRRSRAARTSSTSPRSSAGSRTSTSCRTRSPRSNNALYNAVIRAALDHDVERFVYVSSSMVFERATQFPTTEEHLLDCPIPRSAYGFSKLTGEVYCRAAHDEHGLPLHDLPPVQRLRAGRDARRRAGHRARRARPDPQGARRASARCQIFGCGEQTRTLTHVDDIADGIVTAMASPAGAERGLQHLGVATS